MEISPSVYEHAAFMAKVADRPEVRIRINMDLRVVASGTADEIKGEADRCLALAGGRENVCLGSGSLPYETRPGNVKFLIDYVAGCG